MAKPTKTNGKERIVTWNESFEVCGLTGTLEWDPPPSSTKSTEEEDGGGEVKKHLHITVSDEDGWVKGGLVLSSLDGEKRTDLYPIYTTAEVCLLADEHCVFSREHCNLSGWPELLVKQR